MKSLQGEHVAKVYATILVIDLKIMPEAQQ